MILTPSSALLKSSFQQSLSRASCDWSGVVEPEGPPVMGPQRAISLVTARREVGVFGFNWVFLTSGTSFYIRARYAPLSTFKISLHGPDSRETVSGPVNFLYTDQSAAEKAAAAGGRWFSQSNRRTEFKGRKIAPGVRHVVRIRTDWRLFVRDAPSGPVPTTRKATFHGALPAPRLLRSSNIDVFVSDGEPYWPDPDAARAADAGFGPIVNKAGQSLTIQAEEMRLDRQPDPFDVRPLTDNERAEAIRAVIAAPDETGLCWVCEKLLPASHVLDGTVLPVAYGEPFSP